MVRSFIVGVVALALVPTVAIAGARGEPPVDRRYDEPLGSPPGVPRHDDRRSSGMGRAAAYQRPAYGYTLPREWIDPAYVIGAYDSYDLPDPAAGFGWSRYYDDAVLTDRWGRVYDVRYDFEDESNYRGRRHHRERRYSGYAQPHWDMGYFEGQGAGYGYATAMTSGDCGCGESVTTTTTRTLPGVASPVRYERYETVREPAPRRVAVPRGKYVRIAR